MYAITGATGNTGRVVATTLLKKKQIVRVIGRNEERLATLSSQGADPFSADLTDADALTRAFAGAKAVYAMIPPDMNRPDFRTFQEEVSEAIVAAIKRAQVEYVVVLSSIGADKPNKTGPVVGLRNFEQKLNGIPGVNVLALRAGYFMENTLPQIQIIKERGTTLGALRPDLKLPMIATRDIGAVAGDALGSLNFRGKQIRELLGQRDLSMPAATEIIGKAIGKPDQLCGHFCRAAHNKSVICTDRLP